MFSQQEKVYRYVCERWYMLFEAGVGHFRFLRILYSHFHSTIDPKSGHYEWNIPQRFATWLAGKGNASWELLHLVKTSARRGKKPHISIWLSFRYSLGADVHKYDVASASWKLQLLQANPWYVKPWWVIQVKNICGFKITSLCKIFSDAERLNNGKRPDPDPLKETLQFA